MPLTGNIAGLIFAGIFCHQLFALSAMSKVCVLLMVVFAFAAESLCYCHSWLKKLTQF